MIHKTSTPNNEINYQLLSGNVFLFAYEKNHASFCSVSMLALTLFANIASFITNQTFILLLQTLISAVLNFWYTWYVNLIVVFLRIRNMDI